MIKISREYKKSKKAVSKPNVLCVGFAKCGTTTLYDILAQHPDIYLSRIKEPIYYSEKELEEKGFEWYLKRYYLKAPSQKVIMEINPLIAKCDIPKKIVMDYGKDTKIIFLIRNPISRLYSNFKMNMLAGQTFTEKKKHCIEKNSVLFDWWVKENFYYHEGKIDVKNVAEMKSVK